MQLEKLFKIQKVLRDRINYNEPDRFNKLILALLVELGECANEWRGFKFWSQNQIPHTSAVRTPAMMEEDKVYYNPLLEEHVDGLHFILDLGIEKEFDYEEFSYLHEANFDLYTESDITTQFIRLFNAINEFADIQDLESYEDMFLYFIGLGRHLNFTWGQIEQAYLEKNKINHQRQDVGY